MKNIFSKIAYLPKHFIALCAIALVSAQSAFAQTTGLEIPAGTADTLIGYVNNAFSVVIGVIVVTIAVGIIIRMLRKAGG